MRTPRAFTLIELLVVIAIIGMLVSIVAVNSMGAADQARVDSTKWQMGQIESAVSMFKLKKRRLPETLDDLVGGVDDERFLGYSRVPRDAWGGEFLYEATSRGGFQLTSFGEDGRQGGDSFAADITRDDLIDVGD